MSQPASRVAKWLLCAALVSMTTGCVMRYSTHRLEDTWYDDKFDSGWIPHEFGLVTPDVPVGPSAFSLSLEGASQDLLTRTVPPIEDWDSVKLRSAAVGLRFFPIASGQFRPYGGGGYSRSTLSGHYTGPNYDPAPGIQCIGDCTDDFTEILHRGYNPFVVGGVELGSGPTTFVIEYRKDIDRGDGFYRLSGSRYSVGLRWRTLAN